MSETTDRIPCPHCGASNFPTSATCWQCGRSLRAESQPPAEQPPSPGQLPPSYQMSSRPAEDTKTLVILGFVFAGLSLFCCCPLFGIAGIIMGIIVLRRGNPIGTWIIVLAVALIVMDVAISQAAKGYLSKHPELFQPGQRFPFPMPPPR